MGGKAYKEHEKKAHDNKRRNKKQHNDKNRFDEQIRILKADPEIQKMASFTMHNGNTTLQHVENVAECSFRLAEKLGIDIDEEALARGAMLHDFYLYTFKETKMSPYRHGISHPETALKNASKNHHLTDKETNIIRSHMWPMTFLHPPMSKEAVLVCLADKYCAANEMLLKKHDLSEKKRQRKNKI